METTTLVLQIVKLRRQMASQGVKVSIRRYMRHSQRHIDGTYGVNTRRSLHLEQQVDRRPFPRTRNSQSGCFDAQGVQNRSIVTDAGAEAKMNLETKSEDVATWYNHVLYI
jgi:hypothetical protein